MRADAHAALIALPLGLHMITRFAAGSMDTVLEDFGFAAEKLHSVNGMDGYGNGEPSAAGFCWVFVRASDHRYHFWGRRILV